MVDLAASPIALSPTTRRNSYQADWQRSRRKLAVDSLLGHRYGSAGWRVGGLAGWRVGGLAGWMVGGLGWKAIVCIACSWATQDTSTEIGKSNLRLLVWLRHLNFWKFHCLNSR
jgi:hypothetical protein